MNTQLADLQNNIKGIYFPDDYDPDPENEQDWSKITRGYSLFLANND